jgi:hypothetical protein
VLFLVGGFPREQRQHLRRREPAIDPLDHARVRVPELAGDDVQWGAGSSEQRAVGSAKVVC